MGTKLYVGNLPFNTTENELQELFSQAGAVQEVTLMQDRFTGKSRGFAFVTMGSEEEAQNAISKFDGQTMDGRPMTVNEARPREQRPPAGWWPTKRLRLLADRRCNARYSLIENLGRAAFEPAKA